MQASLAPGGVSLALNTVAAEQSPSGAVRVLWGAGAARMALIRDRRTGEILSFARGGAATIRSQAADLDVILSDGVHSAVRSIRITR
jgi:hypothetical protein